VPSLGESGSVPPDTLYTFLAWTRDTFLFTVTFICRARRVVENAFGNLAARCWVYAKPVDAKPTATDVTITFFVLAQLAANYISTLFTNRDRGHGGINMAEV
jgi:hypothetical protein